MKKIYIAGLLAACTLAACRPNLKPETPQAGDADFSKYLAVGASLTAGFSDGSLYRDGQKNSFPAMLAKQFRSVGGGKFEQPLLPGEHGYPRPKFVLDVQKGLCDTVASLGPRLFPGGLDSLGSGENIAYEGPYNNMGIPGIRAIDYLFPGYGMLNPYANRLFANPMTAKPLDDLRTQQLQHTFFTLWIGNNDVLGYATEGGDGGTGTAVLSDPQVFTVAYDSVMNMLTARGAKGIVVNIPDVTATPYFTTIPAMGATVTKDQANTLNNYYNQTQVHFTPGANYFVIEDTNTTTGFRQIKQGELVLLTLPLDSVKCKGWGTFKPIPGRYILTADEIAKIKAATQQFNVIISNMATKYNIPMVDIQPLFNSVESGMAFNGVNYTTEFVSGSAFSLDGIHPTQRGYALIANEIIEKINMHYGSSIPYVDPNEYKGVLIP